MYPLRNKFKNVDSKQTEKASKALNEMLDTLYLTVFRNHSIKAFKSKLETSNLKKILLSIKTNKEKCETSVKDVIQKLENNIIGDIFNPGRILNETYDKCEELAITGAICSATFFFLYPG